MTHEEIKELKPGDMIQIKYTWPEVSETIGIVTRVGHLDYALHEPEAEIFWFIDGGPPLRMRYQFSSLLNDEMMLLCEGQ